MKIKIGVLLIALVVLFSSCDNEEAVEVKEKIVACFEIDKDTVLVGEEIQLTSCSEGGDLHLYYLGGNSTSNKKNPTTTYSSPGEYTIKLDILSGNKEPVSKTKKVYVKSIESNFFYPETRKEDATYPIDFDYVDGKFYYLEVLNNVIESKNYIYSYVEVDPTFSNSSKSVLGVFDQLTNRGFLSTLSNGNKTIYTHKFGLSSIGSTELIFDASWTRLSLPDDLFNVLLSGSLPDNNKSIYYGGSRSGSAPINPLIELRDDLGNVMEQKVYSSIEMGFIGDLIKDGDNYLAFGGIITPSLNQTSSENYKPLLMFLNSDFELIGDKSYDNTSIKASSFGGSFHIVKLLNDNFVLYSHNEFRIVNSTGEELKTVSFLNESFVQGLISIKDGGFILSTRGSLRKYDANGELVKNLKFNCISTPELIMKDDKIFFASFNDVEVDLENYYWVRKAFIGAVDTDLNIINLNE